MDMTFKLHVLENHDQYQTLEEALVAFFRAMKGILAQGTCYQGLTSFYYIEGIFNFGGKPASIPVYYYDALRFAYNAGILIEVEEYGKWPTFADPLPKIPSTEIEALFALAKLKKESEERSNAEIDQVTSTTT